MAIESGVGVSDHVTAQMHDCPVPDPEQGIAASMLTVVPPPETTPTVETLHATIEQTGADPPPKE